MTQETHKLQKGFEGLNPTEEHPATGYLGTLLGGAYTIVNTHYPSKFYVRFPDHRFISALHKGRVRAVGTFAESVEVEVFVNERNQWEIKGTAPATGDATQQIHGNEVYLPEHGHNIVDMNWIIDKSLVAGNLLLSNGTGYDLLHVNQNGSGAPTVDDDVTLNYGVGSWWYDSIDEVFYDCKDATNGAAVWEQRSAGIIPPVGKYRQFVYDVVGGDIVFATDEDGFPVFELMDLE